VLIAVEHVVLLHLVFEQLKTVYAFVAIAQLLELLLRFLPRARLLKEIEQITSYLANLSSIRSSHRCAFPLLVDVISDTPFIGFG
jgi:hypothetical protein